MEEAVRAADLHANLYIMRYYLFVYIWISMVQDSTIHGVSSKRFVDDTLYSFVGTPINILSSLISITIVEIRIQIRR